MYITGNWKRQLALKEKYVSDKIIFTGFLPLEQFNSLLAESAAIITGTKREYTSLMSGWEAIAYAKPLAITETQTLKNLFGDYAVFFDWTNSQSIADAVERVLDSKPNLPAREKLRLRTVMSLEHLERKLQELC
jgi:glycosyltransferase involved in cell wall biosynthesis